ncbi:hypothetical protein Hanom_Chr17g01585991 [Helianthus anomalus]
MCTVIHRCTSTFNTKKIMRYHKNRRYTHVYIALKRGQNQNTHMYIAFNQIIILIIELSYIFPNS